MEMYDIRQFKPAMYVLLTLGIAAFALAAESGGALVLGISAVCVNAWLVKTGRFRPMPRLIANLVTVLGLLLLVAAVRRGNSTPILVIGHFLVFLQIVKLFEQRANRDYAQLLVLSLLLMVAAAISTASLLFGLMFIAYLFLSLYCCLLFHLKVETDHARQAIGMPEEQLNPATLRQDQRYLTRSMQRLTALVAVFAIITAVLTFLFFPRGTGAGVLGPLQWRPSQTLTGFSDSVSFQNVAVLTQNPQPVAWVKLFKDGKPYHSSAPLMLRGLTLDRYSGSGDGSGVAPYQWTRGISEAQLSDFMADTAQPPPQAPTGDGILQQVRLDPTGTNVLFAMGGITSFSPAEPGRYRYARRDEVLQSSEQLIQQTRYEVVSSGQLTADQALLRAIVSQRTYGDVSDEFSPPDTSDIGTPDRATRARIDPKILEFASRPEVSGSDRGGPLARQRLKTRQTLVTPLDALIAKNIEQYLQRNFTYTLDLTDARRIEGRDPVVAFLYDLKRGHCEYFAGAMTLMCQSLGLQARMVVGFKCDDYNSMGDYYTVRQSHAHAWVEVLTADGVWTTFDPTSGREASRARQNTLWQRAKSFIDYLQYTWASTVVAYDRQSRNNLIQRVDQNLTETARRTTVTVRQSKYWLDQLQERLNVQRYWISSNVIGGAMMLLAMILIGSVFWFLWEKWKLRRRARRIGLNTLPASEQMKLARQLGFYDDLMRLLEHHEINRPLHLTPLEFSDSLTFLPVEAFDSVRELTEIFYRVRYGRTELTTAQRRQLLNLLTGVELALRANAGGGQGTRRLD